MMRFEVRILLACLVFLFLVASVAVAWDVPPEPGSTAEDMPPTAAENETGTDEPATEETEEQDKAEQVEADQAEAEAEEPEPEEPARLPLSPEMARFRDSVRRTRAAVYARPLSAQSHLPAEIIAFCEAFGHTAEIASGNRTTPKVNGVGALCWNHPCGGHKLLRSDGQKVVPRVGYGYQQRPGQLLAMLAKNRVPATYEVRVGTHEATVADLVEAEKAACRSATDLSGALIGLSFYVGPGEEWKNDLGEDWSVERLLEEELDRQTDTAGPEVIHRLAAISFAIGKLEVEDLADEKLLDRAQKHVVEFHDYALNMQNADGTWNPGFFAYRGTSKDSIGTLRSTGTILAWLVASLPEDRLEDERVIRSLSYVNKQLAARTGRRSAISTTTREIEGIMNAVRAMSVYEVRYFTPRTPPKPEPAEQPQTAAGYSPLPATGQSTSTRQPSSTQSRYSRSR